MQSSERNSEVGGDFALGLHALYLYNLAISLMLVIGDLES